MGQKALIPVMIMANITTLDAPVVLAMPGQDIRDMGGKDALLEQAVGPAKESDVLSPESGRRDDRALRNQKIFDGPKAETLSSVSEYGGSFVALTQDGVETGRFPRKSVEAYAALQSKKDALREAIPSSNEARVDLDADVLAGAVGIDSDSKA